VPALFAIIVVVGIFTILMTVITVIVWFGIASFIIATKGGTTKERP
jgi:hypothetical protein